ncbi:MAG: class I SAM-dependent methyltransferase [Acetobacteraceae bacterium]
MTNAMTSAYFSHVRRDIEELLPPRAERIVDVGCGVGATASWLRSLYPGCFTIGLEGNAACLPELQSHVDQATIVDLNGDLPDLGSPDLVLCLDVLEHLMNPQQVLDQLRLAMRPDSTLIVSLPNVAHLSVALPLLLAGKFEYTDAGILDRTHLHFFTRRSAAALVTGAGFQIERGIRDGLDGPRSKWLDKATFGLLRDRLTRQYVMAAHPQRSGRPSPRITWNAAHPYG